jgi:hypothetical protein
MFPPSFCEVLKTFTLHNHQLEDPKGRNQNFLSMCQGHYREFKCGHKELDLSWSAWASTIVCKGVGRVDLIEELCFQCLIYETAKANILAARNEGKRDCGETTVNEKWGL